MVLALGDVKYGRMLLLLTGLSMGFVIFYKAHDETSASKQNNEGKGPSSAAALIQKPEKKALDLEEQFRTFTVDGKECPLTFLQTNPDVVDVKKPKVLLLHGAAFSASTWSKVTGTMAKLKNWGYTAVAVNLRGDTCTKDGETRGELVHEIVNKLKLKKVVLVSPSKSGQYSIPYIMNEDYMSEIAGFIPIAPVIGQRYKGDDFRELTRLRVMIVQGEKDSTLAPKALELLKNIPSADNDHIVTLKGAGHACYIDKPDEWHKNLQQFLASLSV